MKEYADPLVETMIRLGVPVTRDNYLEMAYPEGIPEQWTAELEGDLPDALRQ